MTLVLSVIVSAIYGWFIVAPANRGYTPAGWAAVSSFLRFSYLLLIILTLILGGFVDGRPVAPLSTELGAIAFAAGISVAVGFGTWLRNRRDGR